MTKASAKRSAPPMDHYEREKRQWLKYLEDHSFPHKRKFPGSERRKVLAKIDRFSGYPHFHVSIAEENNPVWDEERGDWWSTFHDSNGRGEHFSCKFYQEKNADAFIKLIWKDWFKPETHVLLDSLFDFTEQKTSLQRKFNRWMEKVGD